MAAATQAHTIKKEKQTHTVWKEKAKIKKGKCNR